MKLPNLVIWLKIYDFFLLHLNIVANSIMSFKLSEFSWEVFFNSLPIQVFRGLPTNQQSKEMEFWNSWKNLIRKQMSTFHISILLANWHAFYPLTKQSWACYFSILGLWLFENWK